MIDFLTDSETENKASTSFGRKMAKRVEAFINSSYFIERNAQFEENERNAAGEMDMNKFKDRLDMNGEVNYVNIKFDSPSFMQTTIQRLIGRWMATKKEKAVITAIDTRSKMEKKQIRDDAAFAMKAKETVEDMEAEAGWKLMPPAQFVPDDEEHLNLWAEEELRLDEEIDFEIAINESLAAEGWNDVLKEKVLWDSSVNGLVCTETYTCPDGTQKTLPFDPKNALYDSSTFDDFRDAKWKGKLTEMKVIDIKKKYPDTLPDDMDKIMQIAKTRSAASYNYLNDEKAIEVLDNTSLPAIEFEVKAIEHDTYHINKTAMDKIAIDKNPKRKPSKDSKVVASKKEVIYRGVYVLGTEVMLEWGLKKNMIRPQDPRRIREADFTYSFYMYNQKKMRNKSLPEKINYSLEGMVIALLKIDQMIAKMRPSGLFVDISGLEENMDLGEGELSPLELQRVYDQTGNQYYRGMSEDGITQKNPPIKEAPNTGNIGQLEALIRTYNFHLQVLRDMTGINEYAEGQTVAPRVGVGNVEGQRTTSYHATDYMYNAYIYVMQQSCNKQANLMHDTIVYGSNPYNERVSKKAVEGRVFSPRVEMLPQEEDIKYIESMVTTSIGAGLPLLYAFKVRRMARENTKRAELYLGYAEKKMRDDRMKEAQANAQANAQTQMASLQSKGQMDAELEQLKGDMKIASTNAANKGMKEVELLRGILQLHNSGIPLSPELRELSHHILTNVGIPVAIENVEMQKEAMQKMQQQYEQEMAGTMGIQQPGAEMQSAEAMPM